MSEQTPQFTAEHDLEDEVNGAASDAGETAGVNGVVPVSSELFIRPQSK